MKKTSCSGLKFLFYLALGLACLSLGFLITTRFFRAVTINAAAIALPVEDNRWVSFYDHQRKELTKVLVRDQTPIRVSQMPTLLQRAFVQKKDPQFYNYAVRIDDLFPIFVTEMKVFLGLTKPLRYQRGVVSTLAYNLFLVHKKDLPYRIDETILAYKIERKYRKEEILEFYLNNIYFGEGAFGVEAASNYYYNKDAARLETHEIAFLICMATDTLSPDIYRKEYLLQDLKAAKSGRDQVLDEMVGWGLITPKQAGDFKRKALGLVSY
mgnify:FL=1